MAGEMGAAAPNYMTQDQFNSQLDAWWKKQQPLQQAATTANAEVYKPSYAQAQAQQEKRFAPLQSWAPQQNSAGYSMQQPSFGFMGGYGGGYGMQSPFSGYGMGYSQPMGYGGYGMGYSPFSFGQSMGGYGMQTPFSGYRQPMFGGYQSYGQPMFGQFGSF